jgi:hypothetical protein
LEAFRSKRNLVWPRRVWRGVVTLIYPGDKSAAEHEAADCVAPLQRKRAPNPMVPGSGFPGRMTGSTGGLVGRLAQAA